ESASGAETAATDEAETTAGPEAASEPGADEPAVAGDTETAESDATEGESAAATLQGHVRAVIDAESKRARLLDREMTVLRDVPAAEAFDAVSDTEGDPFAVVLDDRLEQRLLDVAAQRGIEQIVARSEGEYVKRPASVRVVTADRLVSS
ncbi:MAG: DNA primase, partial [Halobaculum sp.]